MAAWGKTRIKQQLSVDTNAIIGGGVGVKKSPVSGSILSGVSDLSHTYDFFAGTNSIGSSIGVIGDGKLQFVSNSGSRLVIENSAGGYAIRPGTNAQNLGTTSIPFNFLFAKAIEFTPITTASAPNNGLFIDSADGSMKYKTSTGVVRTLSFT